MEGIIDYFNLVIFGSGVFSVMIFIYCKKREKYTIIEIEHEEIDESPRINYISFSELNSLEHEENYKENTSNVVCSICIEEYKYNEILSVMPCNHKFHEKCLKDWLQKSNVCPLCNNV